MTLTLLLSIATSPVSWAASRWNSNSSVTSAATLPESSLRSQKQVRNINIDQQRLNDHEQWDFKLKPMSNSGVGFNSQEQILLSKIDSPSPQPNTKKDSLVGQSSQVQQATIPATEREIPIWLWWLLPLIPFLGLWISLQLKTQRSKSETQQSNSDRIPPPLSTKSDVLTELPQSSSSPVLGGEIDFKESIESLKTPVSATVHSVSVPRTVLAKRTQIETVQLEENLQPKAEFFSPATSTEKQFYPIEERVIQEVSEAVLIEEIDETEAEAVITEFLTTKTPVEDLTGSEIPISKIVESEPDISIKSTIVEPVIEEESLTIVTVDENLTELEIPVSEIVEPEPDISIKSTIVEPVIEEESPTIVTVDENLTELEIPVSEIVEPEPDIAIQSTIVEPIIEEESPTIVTVDEKLTELEIPVSKIVESEPDISIKSTIVEPVIEEESLTIVTVDEKLTELEIPVSEIVEPEQKQVELELGIAHQDVRSETDVAATKFNLGREIKFEPSLADVDQGLPTLPNGYGQSQIFLLPRDPNWAYAYWDIPNEHKEHLRHQGGKYLVLRVYDVTGIDLDSHPPLSLQEYECDEMTREWYISIPMSDRDYIAELGYLTTDGRWLVLVRSNHIRIPPIYPTDWENDQFIKVPWDEDLRGKTQFRL
ncbi:DUF4912 domain-containing protein [Planktothrix serta]|uniref:DUF4912 domain-containing protein n=1 Tax=Planktothrix serta TaxID=1678310 RepID=UPI0018CC7773|nr:DUF4912 domain-containing protein [Planktothrix serta]